jgi:16S rRNA (cytosine967-C5)-methyltransferase
MLANAANDIIKDVFVAGRVLDRCLAQTFETHPKWGKRDRSFIAETCFEVVRWRRALSFVVNCEESEALCAAQWTRMGYEIPEWWNYHGASVETMSTREADLAQQPRAVRESIPDWLDELGQQELGMDWDAELSALNQRTRVYLRVNTLRTTRSAAIDWLASHNIVTELVPDLPDTLALLPGKTLPKRIKMDGRVEIQDAGSQMIAPLLAPHAGECIIDSCAGAGGKTLHLAALMKNHGRIIAMDIIPRKLRELERRAQRAQAQHCIETQRITTTTTDKYHAVADRLLIDAPCSGLGTLKRQPDLKWRIQPETIQKVRALQAELLDAYSRMLRPGGRLVFATCSVLPSENHANVRQRLTQGGFYLEKELTVSPAATGFDGFYAAVLTKS